jgi:uncharacterized membrane protein YhaH (DUF805 family)
MVGIVIVSYVIGWLVVSAASYVAGRRLADRDTPPDQLLTVMVSFAAGAVWPLLVVGLVELSSVMVFTKAPAKSGHGAGIVV